MPIFVNVYVYVLFVNVYEYVKRQLRGEDMLNRLLHADKQVLLAQGQQVNQVVRVDPRLAEVDKVDHCLNNLRRVLPHCQDCRLILCFIATIIVIVVLRDIIELEETFEVLGLCEEYLPMAADPSQLRLCLFVHLHRLLIRDLM